MRAMLTGPGGWKVLPEGAAARPCHLASSTAPSRSHPHQPLLQCASCCPGFSPRSHSHHARCSAGCPQPEAYQLCAHAKGVVLWSSHAVGWLVHSVPRWPQPPAAGRLVLPPIEAPQTKLSQSFLFVVLPREQLSAVFGALRHMQVGCSAGRGGGAAGSSGGRPRCLPTFSLPPSLVQVLVYHSSDARLWPWAPKDYTKPVGHGLSTRQLGCALPASPAPPACAGRVRSLRSVQAPRALPARLLCAHLQHGRGCAVSSTKSWPA